MLVGCGGGSNSAKKASKKATTTTAGVTTTTTAPAINYQVQRGDTLTSIARKFHVSVATILAANKLANPDRLSEGQTIVIPPAPPVQLVVTPPSATAGQSFALKLVGAKPAESVTFEIDSPNGKFTGPAHTATNDGEVDATYQSSLGAAPGTYQVIAVGTQGTMVRGSFRIDVAPPTTTVPG